MYANPEVPRYSWPTAGFSQLRAIDDICTDSVNVQVRRTSKLAGRWPNACRFRSALGFVLLSYYVLNLVVLIPLAREREKQPALLLGFLLLSLPVLLIVGIAIIFEDSRLMTYPRYAIASLAGLCLLFGAAMSTLRQRAASLLNANTVWTNVPGNPTNYTFLPNAGESRFFRVVR